MRAQRLHRRRRLAFGRAEGAEVVLPSSMRGRGLHGVAVERAEGPADVPGLERRPHRRLEQHVGIAPAAGAGARVEGVGHEPAPLDGDVGGQVAVGAAHPGLRFALDVGVEMHDLVERMHAGVGAARRRPCDTGRSANATERALDAGPGPSGRPAGSASRGRPSRDRRCRARLARRSSRRAPAAPGLSRGRRASPCALVFAEPLAWPAPPAAGRGHRPCRRSAGTPRPARACATAGRPARRRRRTASSMPPDRRRRPACRGRG